MACAGAAKEVGKKAGEKLRGWDWFHSIGSPKYVVAPMVMQSELAFRMMCRRLGAQLCFTPMIHSKVWLRDVPMRPRYFEHHHLDRPLVAQVWCHAATPCVVLLVPQRLTPSLALCLPDGCRSVATTLRLCVIVHSCCKTTVMPLISTLVAPR